MKKILNSDTGRLCLGMALMFAYAAIFAVVIICFGGIDLSILGAIISIFATCYTMQVLDAYYKSKEEGKTFKDAWRALKNNYDDCI